MDPRRPVRRALLACLTAAAVAGCASSPGRPGGRRARDSSGDGPAYCVRHHGCYRVLRKAAGYRAQGTASWYGLGDTGKPTASGDPYRPGAMRVAHKTLPFGTWIRIRNLRNGREAVAMVNDRGPFHPGRIVDGSVAVARRLGFYRAGTAPVSIAVVPRSRLSAAQREAARVDQQRAATYARRHAHGHILAEAGHVTVRGVIDVTELGMDISVGAAKAAFGVSRTILGWIF
ncbi:MAG TPA: septal ring lytic transglycosylase RlpA family protein [Gammaproteobacteria bacterium]|nr:septal ring lytic transglycosylase RlpA family protein [Gammaproteobacteria bacterium]